MNVMLKPLVVPTVASDVRRASISLDHSYVDPVAATRQPSWSDIWKSTTRTAKLIRPLHLEARNETHPREVPYSIQSSVRNRKLLPQQMRILSVPFREFPPMQRAKNPQPGNSSQAACGCNSGICLWPHGFHATIQIALSNVAAAYSLFCSNGIFHRPFPPAAWGLASKYEDTSPT